MTKVTTKKNKKADQQKLMVRILCGALCVVMIVTTLLAILPGTDLHAHDTNYYIDENGNVVTADGTVIGTFEDLFGSSLTTDEDGHVHVEGEEDHAHEEESAPDVTTDETVEAPAAESEQSN